MNQHLSGAKALGPQKRERASARKEIGPNRRGAATSRLAKRVRQDDRDAWPLIRETTEKRRLSYLRGA